MTPHTSDESILAKIQGLVHEEQSLYGQNELSDHDQPSSPRHRGAATVPCGGSVERSSTLTKEFAKLHCPFSSW